MGRGMNRLSIGLFILAGFLNSSFADTHYVSINSPSPTSPYTNWETAAHTIQEAVAVSSNGELVLVTSGTYFLASQIEVTNGITLQSAAGASTTIVDGENSNRCFFLSHSNAVVDGFTITHGSAANGGGVLCSSNGMIRNSIICGNNSPAEWTCGGGVRLDYGGVVRNCAIFGNHARYRGGGVHCLNGGLVQNSTIVSNSADFFGGGVSCVSGGTIENSIIYFNNSNWRNYYNDGSGMIYSYTCSDPAPGGEGNIGADPSLRCLASNDFRLLPNSPCVDAGTNREWMIGGSDLPGIARIINARTEMGAYEQGSLICSYSVDVSEGLVPHVCVYTAYVAGTNTTGLYYQWDFNGDGITDLGGADASTVTNTYYEEGFYTAILTVSNELGETQTWSQSGYVKAAPHGAYVSLQGTHVFPYTNWVIAATTLQAAVEACADGSTIVVTDGTYRLTGEVFSTNALILRSVNGADVTIVDGCNSSRCFSWGCSNTTVDGFTITRGQAGVAGGIFHNCIILDNRGSGAGGGAYNSTLYHCLLISNSASAGGGAYNCEVHDSTLVGNNAYEGGGVYNCVTYSSRIASNTAYCGGGVFYGTSVWCVIQGNTVDVFGGGAYESTLINCLVIGNSAAGGGGTEECKLYSCTVSRNSAHMCGGADGATYAYNTLICYNQADDYPNGFVLWGSQNNYANSGEDPAQAPRIISPSNPQLLEGSPCINAGLSDWGIEAVDLAGLPRTNGAVDIGAYEFWPASRTGEVSVSISAGVTPVAFGIPVAFTGDINGQALNCRWDISDGTQVTGLFHTVHTFAAPGEYSVSLTAWNLDHSVTSTVAVRILGTDVFVAQDGSDEYDGSEWTNAKATIQAAIDDAWEGATRVLVSNGVYDTGGRAGSELPTNRVLLDKPLVLESVNGPDVTFIVGQPSTNTGGYGYDAIRCLGATTGSLISGFTFIDGYTTTNASGGGIWSSSLFLLVSNCVFRNNHAYMDAGGAGNVGLVDCIFIDNSADTGNGGGACNCVASNCEFIGNQAANGGGMRAGSAVNCAFESNAVVQNGGGMNGGSVENCVFVGNIAITYGGATAECDVSNCLLTCNYADHGGGAYRGTVRNSLIVSNVANWNGGGACLASLIHCIILKNNASFGGGILDGSGDNCLIYDNQADTDASGAMYAYLCNCTVVRNTSTGGGAGIYACHGFNNIIVSNVPGNMGWTYGMTYVCSYPYFDTEGWITNDPCFVDYEHDDFRLASNSPCINRGTNTDDTVDLDGNPRIQCGVIDLGAYESSYWGMYSDVDNDGMVDQDEVLAGTDPLSSSSFLGLDSLISSGSGRLLTWRTVFGKSYWIQRSTDLASGVWSNLWNHPISELDEYPEGTESFYDLGVPSNRPAIYRIQLDQ